jgi:hypothetical protein
MTDRLNGTGDSPALVNVDRLLREFYRAEMPAPWPRLTLPSPVPMRRPAQRLSRNFFRLALAASVIIGLAAYWGIAGMFPKDAVPSAGINGPEISEKPRHRVPSKHPSPAENIHTPIGIKAQSSPK